MWQHMLWQFLKLAPCVCVRARGGQAMDSHLNDCHTYSQLMDTITSERQHLSTLGSLALSPSLSFKSCLLLNQVQAWVLESVGSVVH